MRYEFEFDSFEDSVIKGYKWIEDKTPLQIVVLSHGMAETIERYDLFANYLLERDIFVFGHSHRGHGKTAGSIEQLGHLGENGWFKMKEDLRRVIEMAKSDYPDAPLVLLGHSMGSFLARDFILDYSYLLEGVILSGTGYMDPFKLKVAKFLAEREGSKIGLHQKSAFLNRISFGTYNNRIKNNTTAFDWLSRDEKQVQKYIQDPYCGVVHPVSFYIEFFTNLQRILHTDVFKNQKNNLPMLILSGDCDPVGAYGKGVKKTSAYYSANGFVTTLKLYSKGRHEMLNEINKEAVYKDIWMWLQAL
ncbi:alpha/beta fold hydrolase [Fusibacter sp. 3D3]|uniref:alpha/beta fold hydrolase n=1 Tax=Fusibacter sp. 3D3 TaxID=1048380 RepID=UPI000853E643|nr:alpha/beta hydrolase [Fusibacter sp. 3D3]GAU77448.1 putative lysophospholipase [Fusibacter sp. 3D3]